MRCGDYEAITDNAAATENGLIGADVAKAHGRGKLVLDGLDAVGDARWLGPAAVAGHSLCHRLTAEPGPLLGGGTGGLVGQGEALVVGGATHLTHAAKSFGFAELKVSVT